MSARKFAKIRVTLEQREDGGLRAFSEDVPGFVLSNPDPHIVINDIIPTLTTMLSAMWGVEVEAAHLSELNEPEPEDFCDIEQLLSSPKEYVAFPAIARAHAYA